MLDEIHNQARTAMMELLKVANVQKEDIVVVGCSSSEVGGRAIGTESSTDTVSYTHLPKAPKTVLIENLLKSGLK